MAVENPSEDSAASQECPGTEQAAADEFQLLKSRREQGKGNVLGNRFGRFLFGIFFIS